MGSFLMVNVHLVKGHVTVGKGSFRGSFSDGKVSFKVV